MTRITPILKKGDRSDILNYRPIAILSNFAKVFEHLLYLQLYRSTRPYISTQQHGFMTARSTITNLAEFTQFTCGALDAQQQVDAIYTDFAKAFDTVDHSILVSKLMSFGFCPNVTNLIYSYLENRSCYVCFNGYFSNVFTASSGVPQGSNLGPLLFNIYINDLLYALNCNVLAYADDLKIYSIVASNSECSSLQLNLGIINDWCGRNGICLNVDKCAVVSYSRSNNPFTFNYFIGQSPVPRQLHIRDLGVQFDSQLRFSSHMDTICNAASRCLGFVIRSCKQFSNPLTIKTLFYSFVRSQLEYASIIWYPYYLHQQLSLERIQKRFLKYMSYKADGVYPERGCDYNQLLLTHSLQSLSDRRKYASAKFLLKLVHNVIDSPSLLAQVNFAVPRYVTRSVDTFLLPTARTNILYKAPLTHMCRNANDIYNDPFFV